MAATADHHHHAVAVAEEDDHRTSTVVGSLDHDHDHPVTPSLHPQCHHTNNQRSSSHRHPQRDHPQREEHNPMFVDTADNGDGCQFDAHIKDDPSACHLCQSLQKNQTLKQMELTVWASPAVSQRGLQALAKGIEASHIESLAIRFGMRFDFGRRLPKDLIQCVYPQEVVQHLRQLHVHYDLDNADMASLNRALHNNTSLEQVSLSIRGVDEPRGAHQLLTALRQGANLSHLTLRGARPRIYKILFEQGILALGALRYLCIDNANFNVGPEDENDDENIDENMDRNDENYHPKDRNGDQQKSPREGFFPKPVISHVETLVLENCPLQPNDEWMQYWLFNGATHMPHLRECTLKDHELTVAGLERLIQALAKHQRLQTLHLSLDDSENGALTRQQMEGLFYDGRKFPLPMLQVSCATMLVNQLRRGVVFHGNVHLYCRRVQPEALQQLVQATSHYACITSIELRDNGIGMDGLVRMAQTLTHSKLSTFKVCFFLPLLDDEPQEAVMEQQPVGREAAAKAFCQAVQSNMYLQELVVQEETILRSHKKEIDFYLTLNKYGRQLFMNQPPWRGDEPPPSSQQQVPAGLWAHVLAKHRHHADAVCYLLREQPLLVPPPPPPSGPTIFSNDDNTTWSEYNQPVEDIS